MKVGPLSAIDCWDVYLGFVNDYKFPPEDIIIKQGKGKCAREKISEKELEKIADS